MQERHRPLKALLGVGPARSGEGDAPEVLPGVPVIRLSDESTGENERQRDRGGAPEGGVHDAPARGWSV
jgi:hypothetical protein